GHAMPVPAGALDDMGAARAFGAERMAALNADIDTSGLRIEERSVPGLGGTSGVRVRIYTPEKRATRSAGILHIHGGAFVAGSVDEEQFLAVGLAKELEVVVVSVEYRLAPEHPFPAGLEDCYTVLRWLHENVATLDVDPSRVALFGLSAGGGLCAALSLLARDRGGPAICFQYLGFP